MKKWIMALASVFFLGPATGYTWIVFRDNPPMLAPYDQSPYYAVGLISESQDISTLACTGFSMW